MYAGDSECSALYGSGSTRGITNEFARQDGPVSFFSAAAPPGSPPTSPVRAQGGRRTGRSPP